MKRVISCSKYLPPPKAYACIFFSSRRRHTRCGRDWSSDVCSSDLIAEEIYARIADPYHLDKVLINKSTIYTLVDSLSKATNLLNKVKENALTNTNTQLYVTSLIGLAEIALKKNEFESANELFSEIKIYSLDNLGFDILTKYHSLRTLYLSKQGLKREAFAYFEPVMEQVIERVKGTTDTQTGRWLAGHEYLDAFEKIGRASCRE